MTSVCVRLGKEIPVIQGVGSLGHLEAGGCGRMLTRELIAALHCRFLMYLTIH